MSGSITYSQNGVTTETFCTHGESLGKVEEFANGIAKYTAAAIDQVSWAVSTQLNIKEKTSAAYPLKLYAKVLLREQASGKLYGVLIFAPLLSIFDTIEERGYRIKTSVGQDIADKYSAMSGSTFAFDSGWLCGKT